MAPLIRRRALEAAAKVALSFSTAACSTTGLEVVAEGIPPYVGVDAAEPAPEHAVEARYDAASPAPDARTLACNASPPPSHWSWSEPPQATATESTVTCCRDFLSQRLPDGSWSFADEHRADPDVQACCGVVVQARSAIAEGRDGRNFWPCCSLREVSGALACNPWGPPVPPAMPSEWSDAWEIS